MDIGSKIKMLRDQSGMSQEALARAIDISQSALGNYERGERIPDAGIVISLSRFFSVSANYLLGLSQHKTIENEIISVTLHISDESINYIKSCASDLLPVLDGFLGSPVANDFFAAIRDYVAVKRDTKEGELAETLAEEFRKGRNEAIGVGDVISILQDYLWSKVDSAARKVVSSISIQAKQ